MKTNRLFATLTAALMVIAVPTTSMLAATVTPQMAAEIVRGCAAVERNTKVSPTCAVALEKGLNADAANLKTFQDAAKASDTDSAKKLLMKYGLTAYQLKGAKVLIKDETGGNAATRVTITITCCPLTIIIKL